MIVRVLFVLLLALGVSSAEGQVSIALLEPPAGLVQKNQLWNLSLVYSGASSITVRIGLTVVEIGENQPVMTAYSRPITLMKGIKQVRSADVSPVDYAFVSPAFNRLADQFLPLGNYRVCYSVYSGDKGAEITMAEDCIAIEVQPLAPPQLTLPADSANIQTFYPQFSWLPPAPLTLFNDLNYELLLTEVRSDQTAASAIQENIPLFNARRLSTMVTVYPSSNKRLDTGKVYAWRVIARNGEAFAAQSEVWTFKVEEQKIDNPTPAGGVYLELKSDYNNAVAGIIPDNILGIKYYSYDKAHEQTVRFLNSKGELIKEQKRNLEYGNNFLVFKLDNMFQKETVYYIEIADLQMTRYRVSFRMSN